MRASRQLSEAFLSGLICSRPTAGTETGRAANVIMAAEKTETGVADLKAAETELARLKAATARLLLAVSVLTAHAISSAA
jgi:hypothetical protein